MRRPGVTAAPAARKAAAVGVDRIDRRGNREKRSAGKTNDFSALKSAFKNLLFTGVFSGRF
jgi:hypothetical protein